MYADDTSITIPGENSHELQTTMQGELSALDLWFKVNKLSLKVAKTEFMIIGGGRRGAGGALAPHFFADDIFFYMQTPGILNQKSQADQYSI